ncbi:hypothetical protein NKH18_02460 [Streptomyces sp. M10(2022)]
MWPPGGAVAVEVRNRRVASLRTAGSTVAELAAQALAASAQAPPIVPPGRPALPQQAANPAPVIRQPLSANDAFGGPVPVRYSLEEAWEKGILPWKASTARTYLRKRSRSAASRCPRASWTGRQSGTPRTN